jgi:hypothetical protein
MSLYVCDRCSHIENTALARYWIRKAEGKKNDLCSVCDPSIGQWHGKFPRSPYDGTQQVINRPTQKRSSTTGGSDA